LKAVGSELAKYDSDLMSVQEVRWDKGGNKPAEDCTFSCGNGNASHSLVTGFVFFIHQGIRSAVGRLEFINDRTSCITRGGRQYDIIVISMHIILSDISEELHEYFIMTFQCKIKE
jgi:hypothetical protein